MHMSGDRYGIQSNTCAKSHCGASFCGCPKEDRFDEEQPLEFCHQCKKYYCDACDAGLFNSREYMCGCNKPTSCGSCTDSAYCDCCGDGPICSDCYIQCKCGQTYCRMEEACKSNTYCMYLLSHVSRLASTLHAFRFTIVECDCGEAYD